jgi:hypothetical protein
VAATVNALLSTDGGSSFPTVLAANTANDGAVEVTGPDTLTTDARIRLNSVGNVFFALSDQIAVEDTLNPAVSCPSDEIAECTGDGGIEKTDPFLAAFFAGASATDVCDASVPSPVNNAPDFLPLGDTVVEFSTSDTSGNGGSCSAAISVVDTTPPVLMCNSPATITPPNASISFTGTAEDTCDGALPVVVNDYTCYRYTKGGKRIDKTGSCVVSFSNATLTIDDVGGVGTTIEWTLQSQDGSGNTIEETCGLTVKRMGVGGP